MSYILEALKKSQAERQLGELPSIHAASLHGAGMAAPASRKPLWLALAGAVLVLFVVLLIWRQPWQGPVSAPPVAVAPVAVPVAPVAAPVVVAVPVAPKPAVAAAPAPSPAPLPVVVPPAKLPPVAVAPMPAAPAVPAAQAAPAPAADDSLPGMRDLPEPIQRQIAPLAIGGYIYSKDPADRLLLIDKILRHEGEEVAPGLVLEKLQPKAAVFSFKGYRYRVPY